MTLDEISQKIKRSLNSNYGHLGVADAIRSAGGADNLRLFIHAVKSGAITGFAVGEGSIRLIKGGNE